MKKEGYILVIIILFLSFAAISGVYAIEKREDVHIILKDAVDLDGDEQKELIQIKGIPLAQDENFFKHIFLELRDKDEQKFEIELDGGTDPELVFKDLDHDGHKDIFIKIAADGGGPSTYYLYAFKDNDLTALPVPESLLVQSQFLNDYKAVIKVEKNNQSHTFDLKNRAKDYEETGLYFEGQLNEPTELMIHSFNMLEPIVLENQTIGLNGNQLISGAYESDIVGRVESTWVYDEGDWKLLKTEFKETQYEKGEE